MRKGRYFVFEPFCLDVLDERLWRRDASVPLGHKALAVLQRLVSQPDQLVTKDDLLAAAWPQTTVSEAVLTTAIREVRRALGDAARTPRFVQTIHGRGYRFIAPVVEADARTSPAGSTSAAASGAAARLSQILPAVTASSRLVGRETESVRLHEWYASAQQGMRRVVFIAGEAGIGKTALVDAFASDVAAHGRVRIGRGQCVEHYGAGEPYLPILEALGRLGRDEPTTIVELLRRHAPSWLAHLPSLASAEAFDVPAPVTPEKMLRQLAEALEILTAREPMILVLEDLHWSDTATLEWLAYVARRRDSARVLILGTYRPIDALLHKHPLRKLIADVRSQPQTGELVLDFLTGASVEAYVRERCGSIPRLDDLAEVIQRRTGGHPLFVAAIVDELIRQRLVDGADAASFDHRTIAHIIPTSVRQFIEHRFDQLSTEDQAILEAASVAGDPFSAASIATAISLPRSGRRGASRETPARLPPMGLRQEAIEERCATWAREGRFLLAGDTMPWPDGAVSARYRFRHGLFQEVAYARVAPGRRARLHQRIGRRLERAHGPRASMAAAELAMHFAQGRDFRRALSYLEQAARNALQRSAYAEAHRHLIHAFDVLEGFSEGREDLRRRVTLSLLLGHVLHTTRGWGVEDVERVYSRARMLCEELGDEARLLQAMWGLLTVSIVRAELRKTQALSRDVLRLAKKRRDTVFQMVGHMELGGTAFLLGDATSARKHFRAAEALYDPREHRSYVSNFGADMGLFTRIWDTHRLWQHGSPDRARAQADETLALAHGQSHPFTRTITLAYAGMLYQFRRDLEEVDRAAEAATAQATEHGFPYYLAWAAVLRGWSRAIRGDGEQGIREIRRGIAVLQATAGLRLPYYRALLAEACGRSGLIAEGLEALANALADVRQTEERCWEPELYRLRGELLRLTAREKDDEADACFRRAIDLARGQHAKSLELRAAVSLGRLWRDQNKPGDARRLLANAYGGFTEGFDTYDLREARALLEELPWL